MNRNLIERLGNSRTTRMTTMSSEQDAWLDREWRSSSGAADEAIARQGLILASVVGSTVHGLAVRDGVEDYDVMGIACEPPSCLLGLDHFHQWTARTQPDGARSADGDVDLVIYSLRKWARLALAGNPTVLLPLFSPTVLFTTPLGKDLREMADAFASRMAGKRFLGYARAQRERLAGQRGQLRVHRQELVEAYGFDTKFAGHLLRLAHQGVEYLETGRLSLPVPDPLRSHLLDVRLGRVPLPDVLAEASEVEADLVALLDTSPLPSFPDAKRVNAFLVSAYRSAWDWWP